MVTKSAVSLAVEEGVAVAFGRVLVPLKTALTERMVTGKQQGGYSVQLWDFITLYRDFESNKD